MEMKEQYSTKDLMLFDNKRFINSQWVCSNSFELIMNYFADENRNEKLENAKFPCLIYDKLGWNVKGNYDVINSFWTTFSLCFPIVDNGKYKIMVEGNNVKNVYKNGRTYPNKYLPSFPEKYLQGDKEVRGDTEKVLAKFSKINDFAILCHCAANFMPCPPDPYNKLKGFLPDVKDYFPLMIDKIQACYENKQGVKKENTEATKEQVEKWHDFLLENRDKYLLTDYYEIKVIEGKKKLEGKPFFVGQSLSYPIPKTNKEVEDCIKNMIERIQKRAGYMADKLSSI